MALTKAFYDAVNSGNVLRVRIMMKNSLLTDPSFTEFEEMEKVADSMIGVYEAHDGRKFEENKDNWDDNYMDKEMVKLMSNFSHERISHVKEVVQYLRPIAGATQQNTTTRTNSCVDSYKEKKRQDQHDGRYLSTKVTTGVVIGTVLGASLGKIIASTVVEEGIAASIIGITVAGGALLGGVVVGVAVYIVSNNGGH